MTTKKKRKKGQIRCDAEADQLWFKETIQCIGKLGVTPTPQLLYYSNRGCMGNMALFFAIVCKYSNAWREYSTMHRGPFCKFLNWRSCKNRGDWHTWWPDFLIWKSPCTIPNTVKRYCELPIQHSAYCWADNIWRKLWYNTEVYGLLRTESKIL